MKKSQYVLDNTGSFEIKEIEPCRYTHFNFNLSSSDPEASKEETKKNAKAENPTNPSNLLSQATSSEHPDAELENSPNPSSEVSQATSSEQPVAHPENPTKPSNGQPELHNGQSPPKV
ncbi:hypothetical protein JTB14_016241 [Gonioctena quinquepunctata]|nr:hypothetical protein JTB14_016241 [Gonioctena quinquepunctata]